MIFVLMKITVSANLSDIYVVEAENLLSKIE